MEIQQNELFRNGATWLRADCHLHTKADKEFCFSGEDNSFCSNYVVALESAGIRIGIITNHNKFDAEEFRALRKTARKKDIFLLPGVELSVNDGANGIHVLVVFSDQWLENGDDLKWTPAGRQKVAEFKLVTWPVHAAERRCPSFTFNSSVSLFNFLYLSTIPAPPPQDVR